MGEHKHKKQNENDSVLLRDEWKISGDCVHCRRKSYCSTGCKRAKDRIRAKVYSAILSKTSFAQYFGKEF